MAVHNLTGCFKYISSPYRCDPKKQNVVAKVENGFSAVNETFLIVNSDNQSDITALYISVGLTHGWTSLHNGIKTEERSNTVCLTSDLCTQGPTEVNMGISQVSRSHFGAF